MDKIENLPTGDRRLGDFYEDISEQVFLLGKGLPIPSLVGVLMMVINDLVKGE